MLEDLVITLFLWVVGLYYFFNIAKVRGWALAIQDKYPQAFPTRLPERSWYPAFLRIGAVVCLIGAMFKTLQMALSLR